MKRIANTKTCFLLTVAVSALAASGALAAEPIELELSGYFVGAAAYVSGTEGTDKDVTFGTDSEVYFKGSTILDNGLEVSFNAELELEDDGDSVDKDTTDDLIDEVYITIDGGFGRVQFGQQDGVGDQMHVKTPGVFSRIGSTDQGDHVLDALDIASITTTLDESSDATKIIYFTPRLFGLQLGLSYAPKDSKSGADFNPLINSSGDDALEFGISYEREFNDIWLDWSATYYTDRRLMGDPDPNHYATALQLSLGGFAVGGSFTRGDNMSRRGYSNTFDTSIWSAGVTYGNGPWLFGLQYAAANEDPIAGGAEEESTSMTGGVSYEIGPHIQVGAGVQYDDADISFGRGLNEDGTAIFVETGLKF